MRSPGRLCAFRVECELLICCTKIKIKRGRGSTSFSVFLTPVCVDLTALVTLGIKDFDPEPVGHDVDRINMDTFVREA